MDLIAAGRALTLIVVANLVPWAVARVSAHRWGAPLDLSWTLPDGERLFGSHKTWRGLLSGSLACGLVAALWGLTFSAGAGIGALSLIGDALSSSMKRRLRLPPGTEVFGLDQLPEALLPLVAFAGALGLNVREVIVVSVTFLLLDVLVTGVRHWSPRRSNGCL